mgnify:CR=1 FL=1
MMKPILQLLERSKAEAVRKAKIVTETDFVSALFEVGGDVSDSLLTLLKAIIITARNAAKLSFLPVTIPIKIIRKNTKKQNAKWLAVGSGAVVLVALGSLYFSVSGIQAKYLEDAGDPNRLLKRNDIGTSIYDRNGKILYQAYGASEREYKSLDKIPQSMIYATLAAEDVNFFNHRGFSVRGTARALWANVTNRQISEGGSTITQQLAKNVFLEPERTYSRKYKELVLALSLEQRYTKEKILEMYLNDIYYGEQSFGIDEAAETYFQKDASELTLAEAASLAVIPPAPSAYNPISNPEYVDERRDVILDRMAQLGWASADEVKKAKSTELSYFPRKYFIRAPHFAMYVRDELVKQYGADQVERGGLKVYTSLDLDKQQIAEDIVTKHVRSLSSMNVTNGSLVAMDPKTGEIIAMVGSSDWSNPTWGSVNVSLRPRQPGSSIKPLVYLSAFEKGWNGATKIEDKAQSWPDGTGGLWTPQNYDRKFHGTMVIRKALANSYNIPAIKVLEYVGVEQAINKMESLGISTLKDRSRFGLSLVLGGGEVKLLDMTSAYATMANYGSKTQPKPIVRVLNRYGEEITKSWPKTVTPVTDPRYTFQVTSILSDNEARKDMFGTNSPLKLSRPAAAKTGTTDDFKDNWTLGYTPNLTVGVWVGNSDGSAMARGVSGVTGAAPIWNQFMEEMFKFIPLEDFKEPAGMVRLAVCQSDGGIANPWDRSVANEYFLAETKPTQPCRSVDPKIAEERRAKEEADKKSKEDEENAKKNEASVGGGLLSNVPVPQLSGPSDDTSKNDETD